MKQLLQLKKYILRYAPVLIMLLLVSCDKFVEVDQPPSQLTAVSVFESRSTANAAILDVYAQIRTNGLLSGRSSGLSALLGTYADELISYQNGSYTSEAYYNNAVLASNEFITSSWNSTYSQIYAANAVYEGVDRSTALSTPDKNQFLGEALFVRGLLHFYLLSVFGDIPYITTADYLKNKIVSRMPVASVQELIIADLEKAISLLPVAYTSSLRVRPNRAVAQALLARVLLYAGKDQQAAQMATALIDNADYNIAEDMDKVFLKESRTTIWQLSPSSEGVNTDEGTTFIFTSGPPSLYALSPGLVDQFSHSDVRRNWIKAVTDGSQTWYHAFKYKQQTFGVTSLEYSILFRLAEQYLIRAEAFNNMSDFNAALADLNTIRGRAGLADTLLDSKTSIAAAILEERRRELFTEQGHRFFDLKRAGKLDEALAFKPGWTTTDQYWPLPQNELLVNPNLAPQNPGY